MTTRTEDTHVVLYKVDATWAQPLPTAVPFALKLETWLRMAELRYESVVENDPRKGPKGKTPWIVDGGTRIGDSELIVEHLTRTYGVDPDRHLTDAERTLSLAWRRLFEEHFHQVWQDSMFLGDGGERHALALMRAVPSPLRGIATRAMRSSLRKQLHARGLGRHSMDEILMMGRADLNGASGFLADKRFFLGDRPSSLDATAFGFLALTVWTTSESAIHRHARSLPNLRAYCERMVRRFFPEAASLSEVAA